MSNLPAANLARAIVDQAAARPEVPSARGR